MDSDSDSPTYEFVIPNTRDLCSPDASLPSPVAYAVAGSMGNDKPIFKRVPELYFPDGNIILEAGTTHFRVSRGILAARSPVFKEVLSLPQPKERGEDGKVDGCDVVHLFGDDPQEVTYFLKAIYDSSFFEPPPTMTNILTIAGILRLSTKYDVDYLRGRALKHLDTLYPLTLAEFDKRQDTRTTPWRDNTAFYVAGLARELQLEWLMPPVLYCVCSCPAGDIVDGYLWDNDVGQEEPKDGDASGDKGKKRIKLGKEDRGRCVRALFELWNREKKDILGFLTVDEVEGCGTPNECRKGRVEMLRTIDESRDYLDPLGAMENRWRWYYKWVCRVCAEEGKRAHEEERDQFWEVMPRIFGLSDWVSLAELKSLHGGDSAF